MSPSSKKEDKIYFRQVWVLKRKNKGLHRKKKKKKPDFYDLQRSVKIDPYGYTSWSYFFILKKEVP